MIGKLICLSFCIVFSLSSIAGAQRVKKIPVIGVLLPDTAIVYAPYVAALNQGLREFNYVTGQNIHLEYRYADGKRERFSQLAGDLVRANVDIIVVVGGTLDAAKRATNTIPIVVATAGDLVADGYVSSLARPGGNITGSTSIDSELSAKRLEIFKETFRKLNRVAVIWWKGNRQDEDEVNETRAAATNLGLKIQSLPINDPTQIPNAFAAVIDERSQALIVTNNSFTFGNRAQLFELALNKRLPTMCGRDAFAENGCLMSYAASRLDSFRRAAYFIDKIVNGAKPGDLPVQQPTKFELVINLSTAKQIGLTIPPNVLARADRVIK